jgi:RND superfamily putative drug exporter
VQRLAVFAHRHRWPVVLAWVAVAVASFVASSGLGDLLTNRFDLPGTDSKRVDTILQEHFGERGDSSALVVGKADGDGPVPAAFRQEVQAAAERAAAEMPRSSVGPLLEADGVVYVAIGTPLDPDEAVAHVDAMREAMQPGPVEGGTTYLSGGITISDELQPVFDEDLLRGELIAGAVAFVVLLFIFGTLASTTVPFAFALMTVPTTLGIVFALAHVMEMAIYVQNLVTLIGIGIAIDYSLLVVYRFREELLRVQQQKVAREGLQGEPRRVPVSREETLTALVPTMEYAGHAVVFSGLTVAVGLAGLVLLPLPFIQSMGIGGLLIPLVSIAAATTFLPALLSLWGHRLGRGRIVPRRVLDRRDAPEQGFWARLAHSIMRRPAVYLALGGSLLLLAVVPVYQIALTPGSNDTLPSDLPAVQGLHVLEDAVGAGALAPTTIVVDTGRANGAWSEDELAAMARLTTAVRADPDVPDDGVQSLSDIVAAAGGVEAAKAVAVPYYVDPTGRYARLIAASREEYGAESSQALARRLRDDIVPSAGFPEGSDALVGGGPASGVDFIDLAYGSFPYLVAAVLFLSYVLLVRAFRSLLLPLKAVLLNLLAVGATYGLLVLVFQDGYGEPLGLQQVDQIEAWIPIFLFAMLFGLSMDYEVFLVSRMREAWDATGDNEASVVTGLERTGRIVTAAAIIMVAAFAGFLVGSITALQQFGFGLAVAILIDATIIRMLLVPAFMRIAGPWYWHLPPWPARLLRVRPSDRHATPERAPDPTPEGRRAE